MAISEIDFWEKGLFGLGTQQAILCQVYFFLDFGGCILAGKKKREFGASERMFITCLCRIDTTIPAGEGTYDMWPFLFLRGSRARITPLIVLIGGGGGPLNVHRTSCPVVVTHHKACDPKDEISIGLSVAWNPMPRTPAIMTSSQRFEAPHDFRIIEIWTEIRPGASLSVEIVFFLTESSRN